MIKTCYATLIALVIGAGAAHAQAILAAEPLVHPAGIKLSRVCVDPGISRPLQEALSLVCLRNSQTAVTPVSGNTIVIGFVGGFVKHDDPRHPEVLFAEFLRERFGPAVHVEVFSNHDGKEAVRRVESLLDANADGVLAASEKEQARIIIYGHSWGAAQTVRLARELKRRGIPVLLTIQVDSIHKPGKNDSRIPANVEKAVNFYQPKGLLHGRSRISAEDASRTTILGNFRMSYRDREIDCDNYPWLVRVFNKPHHRIENDPRVWEQAASLIDQELASNR